MVLPTQLRSKRWLTLAPHPTYRQTTGRTLNRTTAHKHHLRLATLGVPTDHHVQMARVVGLTQTPPAVRVDLVGLQDDLGGKTYQILQHPSMLKPFSGRPHSVAVVLLLTAESLCHRPGEACLLPHQEEV